jgi:hypothetical protein
MIQFLEYLSKLSTIQGLIILLFAFVVLASIPYYKLIFAFIRMLFKPVKPEILSFDLRYAPDHLIGSDKSGDKEYYLLAAEHGFILNGSKMLLTWKVSGSYRVDLIPFGKNLEGNAAYVIASTNNRIFKLMAFGPVRRVEKILEIPVEKFVKLENMRLSLVNSYSERIIPDCKNLRFSEAKTNTIKYSRYLEERILKNYYGQRFQFSNLKPYEFKARQESLCRNADLNSYLTKYEIIHSKDYSLRKYTPIAKDVREKFTENLRNKYPRNNNLILT